MAREYPKLLYPKNGVPVWALNRDQDNELQKQGFEMRYRHQEYPKFLHHATKDPIIVKSSEEEMDYIGEGAKHKGWSQTPFPKAEVPEDESHEGLVLKTKAQMKRDADQAQRINEIEFSVEMLTEQLQTANKAIEELREGMTQLIDAIQDLQKKTKKQKEEVPA